MTWAGTNFVDWIPMRGRRVPIRWIDNDESIYWNYDEEDFYYEVE